MMQNATLTCNADKLSKKIEFYGYLLNRELKRNIQKHSFKNDFVSFVSCYENYKKDEETLKSFKETKTKKSDKVIRLV